MKRPARDSRYATDRLRRPQMRTTTPRVRVSRKPHSSHGARALGRPLVPSPSPRSRPYSEYPTHSRHRHPRTGCTGRYITLSTRYAQHPSARGRHHRSRHTTQAQHPYKQATRRAPHTFRCAQRPVSLPCPRSPRGPVTRAAARTAPSRLPSYRPSSPLSHCSVAPTTA